jgi:predicted Fe-Mo cluster-binding NifX family protein
MRIAVSTNDYKTVCGHAGQTKRWLIFEGEMGGTAKEAERLELLAENVFHHHKDANGPHPLEKVQALISRSAGEGFLRRMAKKGVDAKLTAERNAIKAVNDYLAGKLKPPPAPGLMSLFCKLRDIFSEH